MISKSKRCVQIIFVSLTACQRKCWCVGAAHRSAKQHQQQIELTQPANRKHSKQPHDKNRRTNYLLFISLSLFLVLFVTFKPIPTHKWKYRRPLERRHCRFNFVGSGALETAIGWAANACRPVSLRRDECGLRSSLPLRARWYINWKSAAHTHTRRFRRVSMFSV